MVLKFSFLGCVFKCYFEAGILTATQKSLNINSKKLLYMKKPLLIAGVILILLAFIIYYLDPYTPPRDLLYPTTRIRLGEPGYASVKSTKIEIWLGPYGGKYSFWLQCEKVGDIVTVEVYVDGKLADKFIEVSDVGEQSYEGKERIIVFITAVRYSSFRYEPFYLEFDYGSHLIDYGGYLYPKIYALAPFFVGIMLLILGFKLRTKKHNSLA